MLFSMRDYHNFAMFYLCNFRSREISKFVFLENIVISADFRIFIMLGFKTKCME